MDTLDVTSQSKPVAGKPILGVLSVATPFIGALLIYLLIWQFESFVGLLLIPLSPICGVILAVVALWRREPHRWLAWIGFLLNAAVLLYLVVERDHIISFGC
jgi:hypothetical protein